MLLRCRPVSGYLKNNPNNIILDFEKELIKYVAGTDAQYYHCVITDSATNAMETIIYTNEIIEKLDIRYDIPERTYHSVYNALKNVPDTKLVFKNKKWANYYKMGNMIDSAGYLPNSNINDLFTDGVDYVILSFGNQKPLAMNRGGAIIFKNNKLLNTTRYDFLKRYIHNGRDSALPVAKDTLLKTIGDRERLIGKRFNLVPEQVLIGLTKLRNEEFNTKTISYEDYTNIKSLIVM